MEHKSVFRIYGNYLRDRKILTASLANTYLEMMADWETGQIRDMFSEFSVAELETELSAWRGLHDTRVCRVLENLIREKTTDHLPPAPPPAARQ